jgi:hypothetical protein
LATIKDVFAQRDPRFEVKATPAQPKIAIGKEGLKAHRSGQARWILYVVLLGSDRESFYLLYPNGYDTNNKIKANKPMTLPTPGGQSKQVALRVRMNCWCWYRTVPEFESPVVI